jgi:hypothetical protein
MSGSARIGMASHRVFCLILAAAVALVLGAGVAIADLPDVPPSGNSNTPHRSIQAGRVENRMVVEHSSPRRR